MKNNMEYIHHYSSHIGGIALASDGTALIGLWFDVQKYFADTLGMAYEEKRIPVFDMSDKRLDIYFDGKLKTIYSEERIRAMDK